MSNVLELSRILKEKALVLVTAESCTGGMIASAVTDLAGSSAIFDRGFVTYSNNAKIELLDVSANILNHYGAVSAPCADAMALGALKNCANADISVSVTGIAGPGGATETKPVGLVYIGVCVRGKEPQVVECHFHGSRDVIRLLARDKAIALLVEAALTV